MLQALNTDTSIVTASGFYFDFLNPDDAIFSIYDIAQSLSKLCRFTGHVNDFYSVAQHSVLVSEIVPPEDALAGLFHDAPEAFLGDIARPLKQLLPDYCALELKIEKVVLAKFGIKEIPESVKRADLTLLATERRDLTYEHAETWSCIENIAPLPKKIVALHPTQARQLFLTRFAEITSKSVRVL